MNLEWYWAATALFGMSLIFMLVGMPVALAFCAGNLVAAFMFMGGANGIIQTVNNGFGSMTSFALVPIPMFLLMGELFYHTNLATRCFNAADKLLGNLPGRLSYVTLIGGTAFAGPAGSSMGACALLGSLMVPEMTKRGYNKYLSIGPIMGVGGLAVIIPPSALTVLLATLGQTDVGDLLIAGIIPGFVLALMYGVLIWAWTRFDPTAAPQYTAEPVSRQEKLRLIVVDVLPMVAVIAFSSAWVKSLEGALRITVMSFLIIFGSATFAQILAFTGASSGLMSWALSFELTPMGMLMIMLAMILFLGCFMDQLSMMLLTAPIFFPLAKTLGFDLTWFGLIMLLALEIGYTTPPFGLLLFVMKGVAPPETTMKDIYLAAMPFIGCVLLLIAMIIVFPPLATWLPKLSH